jgi:IclR family pca regulon transcriptional regulator
VIAAINVSSSATRDTVEHLIERYVPAVLTTAAAIDAELRLV